MYLLNILYRKENSETLGNGEKISDSKENWDEGTKDIIDESNEQTGNLEQEVQLDNLKNWIEINTTYDIIKGTEMYTKLKNVLKDEAEIVKFSNSIHDVIHKYILDYLPDLKQEVLEQINVWLQFSLMETLMQEWEEESLKFFEWLDKSDKKNTGKSLFNLITLFKNWWGFYSLLKKSQTFIDYVNFHKLEIWNWWSIEELVNAKKFKDVLQNDIWEESFDDIKNNSLQDMGLSQNETEEKLPIGISEEEKKQLQEIINNPNFPINKKIVDTINSSVETASNLLDKRHWLRVDATGLFNSLYGISSQLWMFGIKWPVDMLWVDEDWNESFLTKALNFVLSLIWFSWGIMWLHNSFIKENIDKWLLKNPNKQTTIKDIMKLYQKTPPEWQTYIKMQDKFPEITNLTDEQKTKLPENYSHIESSLINGLKDENIKSLDPDIIRKLGSPRVWKMKTKTEKDPKTKEKTETITEFTLTSTEKQTLIEKYLKLQIPELIKTEGFIDKIKGPDSFMLALTWNLMINEFFIEWIKLWSINESLFMESEKDLSENKETPEQQKQRILDEMEKQNITNKHYKAYILATAEWESWFQNIKEKDGENKTYGKIDETTGKAYYGRWYVQLTHKWNYEKFNDIIKKDWRFVNIDIVNNPDIILTNNELAAYILVYGMVHWEFRKRIDGSKIKLSDFNKEDGSFDYLWARAIVNSGSDKSDKFKELAQTYLPKEGTDENIEEQKENQPILV